ncbi:conserved hypothetical protein [Neospora caninum Liverpool]|uniref:Transmembrane protein n=1 Tax=Neospora caninum (strain Liverpool) TaxID=572307 RepID=F0VJB5_NEOCL|nr:conserved hypothetical protein [Neospora caninum Liverpool]CBZ53826.1 conserved hypothetical protein [Neospora caninum Liverpool]CEL67820.1 TPA: hypothetical protein BN1204_036070 [Neospora caninum Liverpool]|eukprot:XP_003883858.1 conserved hypothetical protein [Neospora caninum Liverpool]
MAGYVVKPRPARKREMISFTERFAVSMQFVSAGQLLLVSGSTWCMGRRRGSRAKPFCISWNGSILCFLWCMAAWAREGEVAGFYLASANGVPDVDGVEHADVDGVEHAVIMADQDADGFVDTDQQAEQIGATVPQSSPNARSNAEPSETSAPADQSPKQGVSPQASVVGAGVGYHRRQPEEQAAPCPRGNCPYHRDHADVVEEESGMQKKSGVIARRRLASDWYYLDDETTTSKVLRGIGYGWMAFMLYAIIRHGMSNESRDAYYTYEDG